MTQVQKLSGFTLIELLATLAVASILLAMAAPSFSRLIAHSRIVTADNALVAALHYARNRAVHAGTAVLLCPSSDGRRCSKQPHWNAGWLIARDRDRDGVPDRAPSRVGMPLAPGIVAISSSGRRHVRYRADGSAPGSNLSIIVCKAGKTRGARSIVVANSGRIRQGTPSAGQAHACAAAG